VPRSRMTPNQQLDIEFGESMGRLEISLRHQSHEVFRAEMLRFLRRLQPKATTAVIRREMARRVAERILFRACMPAEPKATLNLHFRRLLRLGFSSLKSE
jgi:hypothetical protein